MDEVQAMLRQVFQTTNELTMSVSGTGSAGMETCVVNLVEPGDRDAGRGERGLRRDGWPMWLPAAARR
jgi:hypothetical protein